MNGAQRAYQTALTLNPFNNDAQARYLKFLARTGQGEVAGNELRTLVQRVPSCDAGWLRLGEVQLMRSEFSDAVVSFQNAVSEKPYLVSAYLGLVEAYSRMGNNRLAEVAFLRASTLSPRHPRITGIRKQAS